MFNTTHVKHMSCLSTPHHTSICNNWRRFIVVKVSARGPNEVPYLDCQYHIDGSSISWRLYSKPLNQYLYLPRSSTHSLSCFRSIAFAEGLRHLKRCKHLCDGINALGQLEKHLVARGYSNTLVREQFGRALRVHSKLRANRSNHVCKRKSSQQQQTHQAFLKVVHSSSLNKVGLTKILNRNAHLINGRIALAVGVQRSIFRHLYSSNWKPAHGREGRARVF